MTYPSGGGNSSTLTATLGVGYHGVRLVAATGSVVINSVSIASSGGTVPSAPTGLVATAGNTKVTLTWNASSGATAYDVKRSTTSGSGYVTVASPTTNSYTNTGLANGTLYYFVVAAKNANGSSANSAQASATPSGATTVLNDGTFAAPHAGTSFVAGSSVLGQWYSQIGSNNATQAASGGNPGNFLQLGLYGSQAVVGAAAPASAKTWTVSFDYLNTQTWSSMNFKMFGLTNGQTLAYAYGGGATGTTLTSQSLSVSAAWTHVTYTVSVPAGFNVIALEWFNDTGNTGGIDNLLVTSN